MSGQQLMEWIAYADVEPFGQGRNDEWYAQLVAMYHNVHRDRDSVSISAAELLRREHAGDTDS